MKEQKTCILSYQAGAKEPDHRGSSQMYWRTRGCRWVGWRWLLKGAVESRREKSTLWIHIYFDYSFIGFAFNTVEHNIHMWFGTVQAFMAQRSHLPEKILFVSLFYIFCFSLTALGPFILLFSVFQSSNRLRAPTFTLPAAPNSWRAEDAAQRRQRQTSSTSIFKSLLKTLFSGEYIFIF